MNIPVRVEPGGGTPPAPVDYRWDEDTDILSAKVEDRVAARTLSVDVEGSDGSWLILDVADDRIRGVEVAVWPTVRRLADLKPPAEVEEATVRVGLDREVPAIAALEVDTPLAAESDDDERIIHFKLGPGRQVRTVRIASNMLLDIDTRDRLAGVWLLDVPPFPMNP